MLKRQNFNKQLHHHYASELQFKIQENAPEKKIFFKFEASPLPLPAIDNKILIICFDALGDFILSTPALFQIKAMFPLSQIDLVVSSRNHQLAVAYPEFKTLWKVDLNSYDIHHGLPSAISTNEQQILNTIQATNYSLIINLMNRPTLSALYKISKMVNPTSNYVTIDYLTKEDSQVHFLKTIKSDFYKQQTNLHFIDQLLEIIPRLSAYQQIPLNPVFASKAMVLPTIAKSENKNTSRSVTKILFNPFGSQKGNTLSKLKSNLILRGLLKDSETQIILFATVAKKLFFLPKSPELKIVESETILDAIQIIADTDLVLTTDTSIMHIATALNKKLIVLKNNEAWRNQFIPLTGHFKVIQSSTKNISKISVSEIKKAINSLMAF